MSIVKRILLAVLVIAVLAFAAAVGIYETIPRSNTPQSRFDAIIVLGYPANADGSPSPIQRERVLEGVREYRAHVAPRLIMTGGAAHNSQVEAAVMARFAERQGVPEAQSSWSRRRKTPFKMPSIRSASCRRTAGNPPKW